MIIKKILETCIDLKEPSDIFAQDQDAMIMKKLAEKFEGVCYSSCFVLKINKIVRRGMIYMKYSLDGDARVSVQFEADVIVYHVNEIINGCQIIKKEKYGKIHAKSTHAGISIKMSAGSSIYKEDDSVPVIVKGVRYNINQSAISVSAIPFMPVIPPDSLNRYKISTPLTEPQKSDLKKLLKEVKDLSAKMPKNKIYSFFTGMLSLDPKIDKPIKSKKIDLDKLFDLKSGDIVHNPLHKYGELSVYTASTYEESSLSAIQEESKTAPCETVDAQGASKSKGTSKLEVQKTSKLDFKDDTAYNIINGVLIDKMIQLQTMQNFLEHYKSVADIQKNKDIWKLYTMLKKNL